MNPKNKKSLHEIVHERILAFFGVGALAFIISFFGGWVSGQPLQDAFWIATFAGLFAGVMAMLIGPKIIHYLGGLS
ncbi:hypothetical protein V0U79_07050 [Hyphobacterium sp. HN65]|uniref:Uncharacterized protein n=1 Tax=Hyphobacterium lacteum TaxID=3116575 RepID=A0ABU7LRA4_9PROT|nr:hypothetical protein [Hyphobacterium sp. HN65]MEE2526119.1 hypothetical protein [Hyphobacterium sp. HN65]